MASFKINPITGELNISGGSAGADKLEGTATNSVVTNAADMVDDNRNQQDFGVMQVKNSSNEGLFQVRDETIAIGQKIQRREEGYQIDLEVGRNWLFGSATSVRDAVVKCTMPAGQTVGMFTGQNIGVVSTIFFGDHPTFFEPFTVTVAGTGIVGYANGITLSNKGDCITLRQVGLSEYVVESTNFDITSQRA